MRHDMASQSFLADVITAEGNVAADRLAAKLHVTKTELASAFGLSRDAVSKSARLKGKSTQTRMRKVVEIINRVRLWAGSDTQAFAWYRSQSLPSFGDLTAEDLVKAGRAEDVRAFLSRIAVGGYA